MGRSHHSLVFQQARQRHLSCPLMLAVAMLELKENLNYLLRSRIAETCLEGLTVKNKIEIISLAWFKKKIM